MKTRYDASINGVLLSDLDERIIVTDVRENKAETSVTVHERPVTAGSFFSKSVRRSLTVTIAFVLWERDTTKRKKLLDVVNAWADGSMVTLRTNDRPGQYLRARMIDPPCIPSAMRWMDEITIDFTAYEFPFWRQETAVSVPLSAAVQNYTFDGNGIALADARVTNTGSAVIKSVAFTAVCGNLSTTLSFDDLNLQQGKTLMITHTETGLLSASVDGASVLECMTNNSSDELEIVCGKSNACSFSVNPSGAGAEAVLIVQGVWL